MRDLGKLISSVDEDIAWRKKEVAKIISMDNESDSELIVKLSLLLLYSHWEGCVKNLCKLYLSYVSDLSINLSDLTENYKAIALKGKIKEMFNSRDSLTMTSELSFIKFLDGADQEIFKVSNNFSKSDKDTSIINTKSNLNYKVFTSFLEIIGIGRKECLQTQEQYIDVKLLGNRNKIAHGNKIQAYDRDFDMNIESVKKIKALIFSIINSLASDIKYYAENQCFLSKNFSKIQEFNNASNEELKKTIRDLEL